MKVFDLNPFLFKILLIFILFFLFRNEKSYSQYGKDSIYIYKSGNKYIFRKNSVVLSKGDIKEVMKNDVVAKSSMDDAYGLQVFSSFIGFGGGFMFGYQIGKFIMKNSINKGYLLTGLGLSIISIGLEKKSTQMTIDAINSYNSNIYHKRYGEVKFKLNISPTEICFHVNF